MRGRGLHSKALQAADLERRTRVTQIRAAARKGKTPAEIASLYQVPLQAVQRVLAAVEDARVCDPARLLQTRKAAPGTPPADVQIYWVGFLTAAGHIFGQGASSTLIVTFGEGSRVHMETLMADLADPHVRYEFCRSSLSGWQLYLRDQSLCKALIPWGIPSDFDGDDPALLDDLPGEFVAPFLRGYLDGSQPIGDHAPRRAVTAFMLRGTPALLAGISRMIQRCWRVAGGVITEGPARAELRYPEARASRVLLDRLRTYAAPVSPARGESSAG